MNLVGSGGRWSSAIQSARKKGKPNTAEHRAKISAALAGRPRPNRRTPIETRFWKYVERIPFHTCWEWMGHVMTSRGGLQYGRIASGGGVKRMLYAHRVAFELHKGPIPAAMEIDHLCRNTRCVNPAHLEAVTPRVNILRSNSVSGHAARKTHCPQGHAYTSENLGRPNGNARKCRVCHRDRERVRRAARAEVCRG